MNTLCTICLKPTTYFTYTDYDKEGLSEIITECPVCRTELRKIDKLKNRIINMQTKKMNMAKKLYQVRITEHQFRIMQLEDELETQKEYLKQIEHIINQ